MMALIIFLILFVVILLYKKTATLHERIFPALYRRTEFMESRYPPKDKMDFRKKVERGYHNMKHIQVVICGISRNNADILPLTLQRIETTGLLFKDYRVVVFENDSTDNTLEILRQWQKKNTKVYILTGSILNTPIYYLSRSERLAWCRNQYLNFIRQSDLFDGYEYLMVVDMDLRGGWSYDGIASSFSQMQWDIMVSNSIGYHFLRKTYYDTYALYPRNILIRNWFYRIIGEGWQLNRNDPLIPIQSGFGGLGLYRKNKIMDKHYAGKLNDKYVCEHRALNPDNRLRCFLNPSQVTITGTQDREEYRAASQWKMTLRKVLLNW